ncbi:MAG: hypothetical protein K6G26_02585 [Lachnospiraceae bacterium]|nr:hypothetical protein [Lachnospiraceae bacterium]
MKSKILIIGILTALCLGGCGDNGNTSSVSKKESKNNIVNSKEDNENEKKDKEESDSKTMQYQLGASGFAMQVPKSYKNGEVTIDELSSHQIAYYYSSESDMDFDIYQIPKLDKEVTLEEFLNQTATDFDGENITTRDINGITVGTYTSKEIYDDIEYDVLVALVEDKDEFIEVLFWLDGENAPQEVEDILVTIAPVETYDLKLGKSPYTITIPKDYKLGDITEEEAADDMIGYYYNETTPLDFDVYEFGKAGYTLEKYAIEEANIYEAERVDYRTINGIDVAVYYSYEEYDGQMYNLSNYLFEYDDNFVELAFWLDGEIAVKQADRIISTLKKTKK